jgi:regulator of protease activity HflC (stomatin/prohibitin superfamily)
MKKVLLALVGVVVLVTITLFFFFPDEVEKSYFAPVLEPILAIILGIIIGLLLVFMVFFIFGLVSPLFVDYLVNNPRPVRDEEGKLIITPIEPGRIYFFTFLEDGQVKVVVKGNKFIRAIMADPERIFTRSGGDPKNFEYWGVRRALPNEHENPVDQFKLTLNPLSWWIHYMYWCNGAVWVGIPFLVGLRIVKNVRVAEKKLDGRVVIDEKTGLPVLENVEDWSDHLRTKTFYWYFRLSKVDSRDNIEIGYTGLLKVRCTNPCFSSFDVDHWDSALTKETSTWINNFNRARWYDDLVSSPDQTRNEMADFLLVQLNRVLGPGGQTPKGIGMVIDEVNVTDQDPQLTEAQKKAQTAKWEAERVALATVITAEADKTKRIKASEGEQRAIINISLGKKQAIINEIAGIQTEVELGKLIVKYKAWGELAQTDKATIFLGNEGGGAEINAAILKKLQEISQNTHQSGGTP